MVVAYFHKYFQNRHYMIIKHGNACDEEIMFRKRLALKLIKRIKRKYLPKELSDINFEKLEKVLVYVKNNFPDSDSNIYFIVASLTDIKTHNKCFKKYYSKES